MKHFSSVSHRISEQPTTAPATNHKEKVDRSCVNCQFLQLGTLFIVEGDAKEFRVQPREVVHCGNLVVQTEVLRKVLDETEFKETIKNVDKFPFPVSKVSFFCQGRHFKGRDVP
jgi:hypothetical protein